MSAGRRNWPWTESQRDTLRKIKRWRRMSKRRKDTNFKRGKRVTFVVIAQRLNEHGLTGPAGEWSAQAVARQIEKSDATQKRKPPKTHLRPREYLTWEQITKCEQACGPRDRLIFDFLIRTGLRPGCEFAKLQNRDLQWLISGPAIHVREGKRKKERYVKISKALAARIHKRPLWHGSLAPMFPDTHGGALTVNALRKRLAKIGQRAGIDRLYPYRCRHSFGVFLYECKKDIRNVANQMGHSDIKTTMIYVQTTETASTEQAEGLEEMLR